MTRRIAIAALVLTAVACTTTDPPSTTTAPITTTTTVPAATQPGYSSCDQASGPVHRGDPGYSPRLDRDGDGIACEGS